MHECIQEAPGDTAVHRFACVHFVVISSMKLTFIYFRDWVKVAQAGVQLHMLLRVAELLTCLPLPPEMTGAYHIVHYLGPRASFMPARQLSMIGLTPSRQHALNKHPLVLGTVCRT